MEATIIINGIQLSSGQSMALRAAVTELNNSTSNSTALGDDAHGRAMTKAYFDRTSEILAIIRS